MSQGQQKRMSCTKPEELKEKPHSENKPREHFAGVGGIERW